MEALRIRLILILTLATAIIAGAGGYLLERIPMEVSISMYWTVPLFFFLLNIGFVVAITQKQEQLAEKKRLNLYLIIRLAKLILSILFFVVYWLLFPAEIKIFLLVFGAFYILYLAFETYGYTQVEKRLKSDKKKNDL